jgi:hypothetical protein
MSHIPRPLKWPPIFPLQKGLVGWWLFDDRSGAVLRDRSGKKNHGTLLTPTWVTARRGSALSFNGTADYVSVANSASLNMTAAITVEAWIKPSVPNANEGYIINKTASSNGYEFMLVQSGQIWMGIWNASVTRGYTAASLIAWDTWIHIAWTYDSSTPAWAIYLNGVSRSVTGTPPSAIGTNTAILEIGRYLTSRWFKGLMGRVRIYNRALTAGEIKRHAESELMLVRA